VPAARNLIPPERYQVFVATTYVLPMVLEQIHPVLAPGFFIVPEGNLSATPRFQNWMADSSLTIRQTYYHAALCDLYGACLGALSGLYPESVFLIGVVNTVLNHLQLQNMYLGLDTLRVKLQGTEPLERNVLNGLWLYRVITLLWVMAISVLLDRGQRKEFSLRLQLRRAKDQRIEQLKQEKEHLDWDRRLARKPTHKLDEIADASSAASCAELEMVLPQTDDEFEANLGADSVKSGRPGGAAARWIDGGACGGACSSGACGSGACDGACGGASGGAGGDRGAAPLAAVRLASNLNWDETQQLRKQACVRRPQSSNGSVSESCSSMGGIDLDSARCGHTCARRESALWRTLRKTGLVSPTPSEASSAPVTVEGAHA
jgi:hypothetical protein